MQSISESVGLENKEISILFVDNGYIQELNKKYRNIDKPTDVLSFSQLDENSPQIGRQPLGDIVISLDRAMEDAKKYDMTFWEEVVRLLTHGTLHLIGYDHEEDEDRESMEREEERIIKFIAPKLPA